MDKLLVAIDRVTISVGELASKVEEQTREGHLMRSAVNAHGQELGRMRSRLEVAEKNGQRTERERREGVRAAIEGDAKIENAQAGHVIAVEETRKNAKLAVELASKALEVAKAQVSATKEIVVENKAQTAALVVVAEEEQKKPKIPMKLAALLNLAVVVGYVVLELLKSLGKH